MEHLQHYLTVTVKDSDHWQTNWDRLWDYEGYSWELGVTPFSQPIIPFITLFLYLIIIFFIQVCTNLIPVKTLYSNLPQ